MSDLRLANEADWIEDLHAVIRELVDCHGMSASTVRRYANTTLRGEVPAPIRDRMLSAEEPAA